MLTTVIYHSGDFDGIFCREIARRFLPEAQLRGWNFGDTAIAIPEGQIYVMDLPVDAPFGKKFKGDKFSDRTIEGISDRIVWIDHHKSSIESHPAVIPGYRIDGVAACRLAWQWFNSDHAGEPWPKTMQCVGRLPTKQDFIDRKVDEPLAVRLVGEYDIWDKRDPNAELFQHGLRSRELDSDWWKCLLTTYGGDNWVNMLLESGKAVQYANNKENESIVKHKSFITDFEGLKFLALNTARCNSLTFTSKDVPETGHDALMGFSYDGKQWTVSLYHAKHRTDLDLSQIAVKHGGGGHRGACGFVTKDWPMWFPHPLA